MLEVIVESKNKSKVLKDLEQGALFTLTLPSDTQSIPNIYMKVQTVADGADDSLNCVFLETGRLTFVDPTLPVCEMEGSLVATEVE